MCDLAIELDDYRWLVSDAGEAWIGRAAADNDSLTRLTARLRKDLSADRVHLVLEQVELRRRAREKFTRADRMFFTRKGLEQATDEWVAAYKAGRLPAGEPVADLCCGIGGDLLAIAARGPATGVERDPAVALLAETNLRALGLTADVRREDAVRFPLADWTAWHVDPDRRPAGRRTTRVELHEPDWSDLEGLMKVRESAAVKLAPASRVTPECPRRAELEWISRGGQCRQLVAWFGGLAREPGLRRATVLGPPEQGCGVLAFWIGASNAGPPIAAAVRRYVFDPDPAILAAGLLGTVAQKEGLEALAPHGGYLTADQPRTRPGLAAFEVEEVLPFDLKRLAKALAVRGIGHLEIKKRSVDVDPDLLRRKLQPQGDRPAVLIIAPLGRSVAGILARRTA